MVKRKKKLKVTKFLPRHISFALVSTVFLLFLMTAFIIQPATQFTLIDTVNNEESTIVADVESPLGASDACNVAELSAKSIGILFRCEQVYQTDGTWEVHDIDPETNEDNTFVIDETNKKVTFSVNEA
jgi:hypothetical protein